MRVLKLPIGEKNTNGPVFRWNAIDGQVWLIRKGGTDARSSRPGLNRNRLLPPWRPVLNAERTRNRQDNTAYNLIQSCANGTKESCTTKPLPEKRWQIGPLIDRVASLVLLTHQRCWGDVANKHLTR